MALIIVAVSAKGISKRMVEVVEKLAGTGNGQEMKVTVVHIAKVWGTGLGLQHPSLKPSSTERTAAQEIAARAALDLRHRGVEAAALVVTGRDVGKALAGAAERAGAGVLVVGRSDAGWLSRLLRGQDPARVLLGRSSCMLVVVEQ